MAAIVEDDKQPDQESSGQDRQWNREPKRDGLQQINQIPQPRVGEQRVRNLPRRPPGGRLLVFGDDLPPPGIAGFPAIFCKNCFLQWCITRVNARATRSHRHFETQRKYFDKEKTERTGLSSSVNFFKAGLTLPGKGG